MRQARYARRGPVAQDVIDVVDFALPPTGAGQALVEVLAAPINPSDLLTLTGDYGSLPPLPATGGNEGIGRVVEVGDGVASLAPGQRVLLPVGSGTWTTHQLCDASAVVPLPGAGDAVQLSMLAVNPPTAALLLREAPLQPGDWVLQNAANSAVGGYLIQLARARGLRTVNVVRRESALDAVRDVGGDVVLVDDDDLAARIAAATDGARVRLAVDAVGGAATERLAQALAPGGTVVNYGAMSGEPCLVSPASLIFRGIGLRGFWLARWFRTTSAGERDALFGELAGLVASGVLHARVDATFAIEDIRSAVAAAGSGMRAGKVVVLPNGEAALGA